jgi:hypothetical protein
MKRIECSKGGRRPEDELILRSVQAFFDKNPDTLKPYLSREIDWTYLLKAAKEKRALPLVYWSIKSAGPESVPDIAMHQLKTDFDINALHNLNRTYELFRLLDLFRSHSIPAIAFKGPILSALIYGNIAFRQFWDLDILVHPEDFIKAKDLVLSLGYEPWQPLSNEQYQELIRSDETAHDCRFLMRSSAVQLELHWKVYPEIYPSRLKTQYLFERAESSILFGHEILSFSPEDMLIFFCHHGTKHQWAMISWICDVAMLIEKKKINWPYVLDYAHKAGIETALDMGLLIAHDVLNAPIPDDVLQRVQRDKAARSQLEQIEENMFRNKAKAWSLESQIFQFRSMKRADDRSRYFSHIAKSIFLPSKEDREFIKLPDFLGFAYILVRPIRLIRTYLARPSR